MTDPSFADVVLELKALLPLLEYGRETHVQWAAADQKDLDANPRIGDRKFHSEMVEQYDMRIRGINRAIKEIVSLRKQLRSCR